MSKQEALAKLMGIQTTPAQTAEIPTEEVNQEGQLPTEPKPQGEDLKSNAIAIVAKKEAALLREREAFKREREAWLKEKEEADFYRTKGKEFDDLAKKDKIAALKAIGWSDTDIINAVAEVEGKEPTAEEIARKAAQEEAQKIREELAKEKEDNEKKENERLIGRLRSDISDKIKTEAEKFEYCAFYAAEAEAQAYEIIVENLKTNGELLSVQEAIEITEELYEDRDKAMASLKKRQPKPAETEVKAETEQKPPSRTRTNVGQPPVSNIPQPKVPTAPAPNPSIPRRETSQQKKERLIAALKNGSL